jgi:asparagine synthase (glutamine-hydrolysing)
VPEREAAANRMVKALHHRGPDGHGIWSKPEATLVHTRLSIIDLSPTGAQPMANEDGTIWTVFNGEIYNHQELRRRLDVKGHRFKGRSDGEVLPHLYEEEGPEFVSKLRGMFAFAIYDTRNRTLLLARDRFGIKPLFYAPSNHRLAFASELNALLELPGIDRRPDRQAIYDFAALFFIPAPETFYSGIKALQPGEMLEVGLDSYSVSWKTRSYHRWAISPDRTITLDQAVDRAGALITAAVEKQIESDVPLGALLSGGIDSSLVSAEAQKVLGDKLQTFNARFSESKYDETWAAVEVARHIRSCHKTLDMGGVRGTWATITDLLLHTGQPFADTSLFAVNAICCLMRRNVTVALSGDGGDEGFGGYDLYWQLARIAQIQRWPRLALRSASVGLACLGRISIHADRYGQRIKDLAGADDTTIIQDLFCWIRGEEHQRLCVDRNLLPIKRFFEPQWEYHLAGQDSRLERLSAHATEVNIRLTLPNDFLFKVDMASMRESMEIRVPLLDEDLFDFGLSLPHRLKVNGKTCKLVLRALAKMRLPRAVANKPKLGFGIPMDSWVDEDFKPRLREELLGSRSRLSEFFREEAYRPVVEAFCDGRLDQRISRQGLYQRAIMFLSVQLALSRPH